MTNAWILERDRASIFNAHYNVHSVIMTFMQIRLHTCNYRAD